jgi:hypothetical protein
MEEMGVDKSRAKEWWYTYKGVAKHALNQKRSSVSAAVKKSVMST